MEQKKILFITQEVDHFLPSSKIAEISKYMAEKASSDFDIRIFTPKYGVIKDRQKQLHDVIRLSGINIIVNDEDHPLLVKVASAPDTRLQVYFVDNDEFFKRQNLFGEDKKHSYSNAERGIFFVRGVMEAIKKLRWVPDIVHCVGWFSAFAPIYIKTYYKDDPCFGNVKVVFSSSTREEVASIGNNVKEVLAFDGITEDLAYCVINEPDSNGLRKLGLQWADAISFFTEDDDPQLADITKVIDPEKNNLTKVSNDNQQIVEMHYDLYHQILGNE